MYIIHRYHIHTHTQLKSIDGIHLAGNLERIKVRLGKGNMMYLDCYHKNKDHIKNSQPIKFPAYSKRFSI